VLFSFKLTFLQPALNVAKTDNEPVNMCPLTQGGIQYCDKRQNKLKQKM